jgi:hypothetical protein
LCLFDVAYQPCDILEGIPSTHASFPWIYLGLPLLVWKLRVDFQLLEDKCAGKFGGKYVTMAG